MPSSTPSYFDELTLGDLESWEIEPSSNAPGASTNSFMGYPGTASSIPGLANNSSANVQNENSWMATQPSARNDLFPSQDRPLNTNPDVTASPPIPGPPSYATGQQYNRFSNSNSVYQNLEESYVNAPFQSYTLAGSTYRPTLFGTTNELPPPARPYVPPPNAYLQGEYTQNENNQAGYSQAGYTQTSYTQNGHTQSIQREYTQSGADATNSTLRQNSGMPTLPTSASSASGAGKGRKGRATGTKTTVSENKSKVAKKKSTTKTTKANTTHPPPQYNHGPFPPPQDFRAPQASEWELVTIETARYLTDTQLRELRESASKATKAGTHGAREVWQLIQNVLNDRRKGRNNLSAWRTRDKKAKEARYWKTLAFRAGVPRHEYEYDPNRPDFDDESDEESSADDSGYEED